MRGIRKIGITGDTHGEDLRLTHEGYGIKGNLGEEDALIICGDFGYIFFDNERENAFLDKLEKECKFLVMFCDGNHENHPRISQYPEEVWNGGKIHRIRKNVIHLMRGQIYDIQGHSIFVMGGAYSIDKAMRQEGYSWWPQEMPSQEEYDEATKNLKEHDFKVDYIITHTAPDDTMSLFYPNHKDEQELNSYLEWVRENTTYKHWYFGHLHQTKDLWRNQTVLMYGVRDLATNEIIFPD